MTHPQPFIAGQARARVWLPMTPAMPPRSSTEMGTLYHVSRSSICFTPPKHSWCVLWGLSGIEW